MEAFEAVNDASSVESGLSLGKPFLGSDSLKEFSSSVLLKAEERESFGAVFKLLLY